MKTMIKISLVLAIAMLISLMAVDTVSATSDIKNEKTNTGINIDSKEKKITSYKITWHANGGKIGSKKTKVTSVKRGSKINKLVASPKRSKYSFKGWFTKKNGGKKITKNTKPAKSVTFFAQWTKKASSSILATEEKKLVGSWSSGIITKPRIKIGGGMAFDTEQYWYFFKKDRTFDYIQSSYYGNYKLKGNYKASKGKITFTNIVKYDSNGKKLGDFPNTVVEYQFEKKDKPNTFMKIPTLHNSDSRYRSLLNAYSFEFS